MKKLLFSAVMALTAFCCYAGAPKMRVYAHPAMIYDDAHCSIYQDYMTDISFHFFYVDKRILDLKASGTKMYIDLPADIQLIEAGVMDRWKTPTGIYTKFPQQKKVINGRKYIRYELPLPTTVLQPTIKKPLPGGMFGGTSNNIVTLQIKPLKQLPAKSMIYWETVGKYAYKGQFSVYPVKLDLKGLQKSRIVTHTFTNSPIFAYSKRAIAEQARLFKDLKIDSIDSQILAPKYKDIADMWKKTGFGVFGGGSLMHVFWYNHTAGFDKNKKIEDRDFLTGIDGRNGRYINKNAYHGRAFCPQAVITPGRHPNNKLLYLGREIARSGATWLDIDIEGDLCIQCYCAECRAAFFKFAKKKPEKLTPVQLVRKYPKEWYHFRNEQTRLLYQALKNDLKKKYPNLKIGANTTMGHYEKDLEDLKYGYCAFAEDPRLMKGTLEYIMADTLTGGMCDTVTVDALYRSSKLPILAIPGSSYCVGYTAGVMCARRMTAEMTGDKYGYEQRYENHRLGMLHLAANGACGLRYGINEACVAKASVDANKLLKQMEDFYLDGKRADEKVAVADLTKGASRWDLDKSRIRGHIWRHYYDRYNGRVQSRMHTLKGDYALGLYNWDPFQTKKWHVRLKDIPAGNWYLTDVTSGKRITLKGKKTWSTAELKKGFVLDIAPVDCRLIKFTRKAIPASGTIAIACEGTTVKPYNQYAWRTGEKMTYAQIMNRHLARPLNWIKRYGNSKVSYGCAGTKVIPAVTATINIAKLPVNVDLKNAAKYGISAQVENNVIINANNYNFGTMQLPVSKKNLLFKMTLEGKNARFGLILHDLNIKPIQNLAWGYAVNSKKEFSFIIPAAKLKKPSKLWFYSIGKKPLSIKSIRVEATNLTKVVQKKEITRPATVAFPFKAQIGKKQTGFQLSGKTVNGKQIINKGYGFSIIYLPVTRKPHTFTMKLTAKDGATLGFALFLLTDRNLPGKNILSPMWDRRLGTAEETINVTLPVLKQPTVLYLYNVSKKGSFTVSSIEIK